MSCRGGGQAAPANPNTAATKQKARRTTRLKPSLGALVHRGFSFLCLAILATSFGFYIQRTLELWLIYELTGSAFHLGLTGLVRGIPVFVLSPFGGVLADRIDRRRFVILVQACNGAVNAGLAFLALTGLLEVWHIYVSGFMNASLNALGAPARNAMVPGLVPREMLLTALSLTAMSRKMSQLTAPVLTGLLVLWLGSGPAYALNGAVYFSAALLVAAIHYVSDVSGVRASPFRSLMEGFGFVRRETVVWVFLSMELITVYLGSYRALLPIFVAALGAGAGGFGLLLSAAAGGAILGVAVIMSLGNLRYKGLWTAFVLFAYSVSLVVLALSDWFLLAMAAVFLLGVFEAVQMVLCNAIVQIITPDRLRGRVLSFQRMMGVGGTSLGEAQSGFVAAFLGAPLTLIAAAVVCFGTTLGLTTFKREVRKADL